MKKEQLIANLKQCLINLAFPLIEINIQRPKNIEHGDFASNIALILAKPLKQKPLEIAKSIKLELEKQFKGNFESIDIAGPRIY